MGRPVPAVRPAVSIDKGHSRNDQYSSFLGRLRLRTVAYAFLAAVVATVAEAQVADLRARQTALGAALSESPADLELMFDYALVSMQIEDYEQAIATLERMLIFNPDLPRVRLELAVAYFRLGVYDVARFYFEGVNATTPPPAVADRIAEFLTEIDRRTARDTFSGFLAVGPLYTTNANLGPTDRQIRADILGGFGLLPADADAAGDAGVRLVTSATHERDLGRPNDDAWITYAGYSALRFRREEDGDLDAVVFSTGPRFALDDEAFGAKARPHLSGGFVRSSNAPLYAVGGAGVDYSETLDPQLSLFGTLSAEWRDFEQQRDTFDGLYGALFAGVAFAPVRAREYRAAALVRSDRTAEDYTSSSEAGLRLSFTEVFDVRETAGFEAFDLPWRGTLFGQLSHRSFDAPDPAVDGDSTRRDLDLRLGGRLLAPLRDNVAIAIDLGYFERFSGIRNYDLSSIEIGVSYVRLF